MRFLRKLAIFTIFCSYPDCARGAADSKQILNVSDVLRDAPGLDGQIICIRGMLVPTTVPEWGPDAELFQELVPLPAKSTEQPPRATAKLGLVDWSLETGIREEYYKPDSFDLLSDGGLKSRARRTSRLDVTALAAVMYKVTLLSRPRAVR